ncbi:MAG: hypothetical protein LR015_13035 [Verrucomicrobia bacterium]|nr:hypothetical protein [Verrucomicrobiota bacterium]
MLLATHIHGQPDEFSFRGSGIAYCPWSWPTKLNSFPPQNFSRFLLLTERPFTA